MLSRTRSIPFGQTGQFNKIFLDYVSGADALQPFVTHAPRLDAFGPAIGAALQREVLRGMLVRSLREQYVAAGLTPPEHLLARLEKENTFTITTGHQLCLFTGPLYFIYKIMTAIRLAESLREAYPQHDFLPVYWMASEDHDFAEIASVHLFGKTLEWQQDQKGAVGKLSTASLQPLLDELKTVAGETPAAAELLQLLQSAYDGASLTIAMRRLVQQLFSKYDLLILDGDDVALKHQLIPYAWDDLTQHKAEALVNASIQSLAANGYGAQVNPRPINLFYLGDGMRERIEKDGEQFRVLNTDIAFTKEQLQQELEAHPEKFSPNVVLRPVYQQVILPNIAYVGGPGELAYWLEYKSMFEKFDVPFPVLVPRSFTLLIDKGSRDRMQKLGLNVEDLFTETEALLRDYVVRNTQIELSFADEKTSVRNVYESMATRAALVDPTLKKSVEAELQKQLNAIDALETKLIRAEKQKQETALGQIRKLKEKFFPGGSLQERYENFIPYYLHYGSAFIDALHEQLEPIGSGLLLLEEN